MESARLLGFCDTDGRVLFTLRKIQMTDLSKHIREGWTVQDFIDDLQLQADMIMIGKSRHKPFRTKEELAWWCVSNQPYYKHIIPEVVDYFAARYGIE